MVSRVQGRVQLKVLPADPIREIIEARMEAGYSLREIASLLATNLETVRRLLGGQQTVYIHSADRIACALGLHLALLYPDHWQVDIPEDEPEEEQLPPPPPEPVQFDTTGTSWRQQRPQPKRKPENIRIWVDDAQRARMEESA